jgi:hypothetical protein
VCVHIGVVCNVSVCGSLNKKLLHFQVGKGALEGPSNDTLEARFVLCPSYNTTEGDKRPFLILNDPSRHVYVWNLYSIRIFSR